MDNNLIKTKYNYSDKFMNTFKVENLEGKNLQFRLVGDNGFVLSQSFELKRIS